MPNYGHNYPLRPPTKVQLRLIGALQEAGFTVERRPELGMEYLVYGFNKGALAPKLDSCLKRLANKLQWSNDQRAIGALDKVMTAYHNLEMI